MFQSTLIGDISPFLNQKYFLMKETTMNNLFDFPNPVNEYAARTVAFMVLVLSIMTLIFASPWLAAILFYGFLARVLTGPKLSPMGLLSTKII